MICSACGGSELVRPWAGDSGPGMAAELGQNVGSSRRRAQVPPIVVCRACGLGWQDPMPSSEAVAAAYRGLEDDTYLAEARNRRRSAAFVLKELERHVSPSEGPLLDVGCSAGFLLDVAVHRGWEGWGVEPSGWLAERARERHGGRIQTARLETADLGGRRYAAVTMLDVLEHVTDPGGLLRAGVRALRASGVLVLNVPHREALVARVLGPRWPLLLPEHLYYFSILSLSLLLNQAGLDIVRCRRHPVLFSLGYLARRLTQHGLGGGELCGRLLQATGLHRASVPLLMGEVMVVARPRGATGT